VAVALLAVLKYTGIGYWAFTLIKEKRKTIKNILTGAITLSITKIKNYRF
jgi:hypothetical protein